MKIAMLESSPHKNGASNTLAGHFIKGAEEAGHTVTVIDVAHTKMELCRGCYAGEKMQRCVIHDDFSRVETELENSDMIVYVTPVYYYLMAAPLKAVIDRLHCFEPKLHGMKSLLIATAHRSDEQVMRYLQGFYKGLVDYLEYDDQGAIMAKGCYNTETVQNGPYAQQAYSLGKLLKTINNRTE